MKHTALAKGVLCGLILGACWFLVTLWNLLAVLNPSVVPMLGVFFVMTLLLTPCLCGVGGFLGGRDSQRIQGGVSAGLLTAGISALLFLLGYRLSSILLLQVRHVHLAIIFLNVHLSDANTTGSLLFLLYALFAGALFGLLGGLLGKAFSLRNQR